MTFKLFVMISSQFCAYLQFGGSTGPCLHLSVDLSDYTVGLHLNCRQHEECHQDRNNRTSCTHSNFSSTIQPLLRLDMMRYSQEQDRL